MFEDEIGKAISAHGQWKQKLRGAIDTGSSDTTPEKVRQDCNCAFGKWLYEHMPADQKSTSYYKEVRELHAKFHVEAGSILGLAVVGKKNEANELMKMGGNFSKLSSQLTKKLQEWRASA
ncbi:MAG: CZB domain-containing protein [Granulosicoccaceae bacterium]